MPRLLRLSLELAFGLCCLELGLRAAQALSPRAALLDGSEDAASRIAALRLPAGTMVWGSPTDARGFVDQRPPPRSQRSKRLVLALGGSNNVPYGPAELHFAARTEQALVDTEVYCAGIAGLDLRSFAELCRQEAASLEPDAIVLSLFLGDLLPAEPTSPRPLLSGRLLGLLSGSTRPSGPSPLQAQPHAKPSPLSRFTQTHPWLWDPLCEPPALERQAFLALERQRAQLMCAPPAQLLARIRSALQACKQAAGSTPLYALLIPDAFMLEDSLWRELDLELDRHAPRHHISRICAELEIACIDPLPRMLDTPALQDGDRHLYLRNDPHLNPRGNRVLAASLSAFLRERPR